MDIRGRSNYPFRAPLTGPRIIPPSGRPCVGLTRLSSDRVAERRRGRKVVEAREGYGFGRAASKRKDRARSGERVSEMRSHRGSRREARGGGRPEGVRRTVGGRAKQRQQEKKGEGQRRRGVVGCCRACADKGNLRLQPLARSLARPSSPPALATHTRVTTSRMHARTHIHKRRRAIPRARARMYARRAAETAGTVGRGSASQRIASLSPLLLRASSSFSPVRPPATFTFASSTLLLVKLTAGEGDKEATVMKSFRDLQSAAPVPS